MRWRRCSLMGRRETMIVGMWSWVRRVSDVYIYDGCRLSWVACCIRYGGVCEKSKWLVGS